MQPTDEEIRRAAYDRWERRGWPHGGDRDDWYIAEIEAAYRVNYRTAVDLASDGPGHRLVGEVPPRRCRFCERPAGRADFGGPRPVAAGLAPLLTGEVCGECQADWRDGLEEELVSFWGRLGREATPTAGGRPPFTVAAFKAMTASALLVMPPSDLRYFGDALEWVSNPDHDADDRLLDRVACRVYRAPFLGEPPRAALARRVDDEAPSPYMLFFLESGGIMVQVPLPMCLRDEDLDGREVEHPERIALAGRGHGYREARGILVPLSVSTRRSRGVIRAALAS